MTRKELENLSNEDLYWQMVQSKNKIAQKTFYNRFSQMVFLVACRYLVQEDARDVAIQVMNKILAKPTSEPIKSVPKYLFHITKNDCLTWLKRLSRKTQNKNNYAAQILSIKNVELPPEFSLYNEGQHDDHSRLYKALDQLKPDQRQCLTLVYFENCSYIEAARIMDIEIKQVKSYVQNGKLRLKNLLKHNNI